MNLFLDTSALVKIYHQEKGTSQFSKYLTGISEELFITTSDLAKIELHSVFLKKFREKEISQGNLSEVFQLLDNWIGILGGFGYAIKIIHKLIKTN